MAVSFQTDNDATATGDGVSYMMTMIREPLTRTSRINANTFEEATKPFYTPDGCYSVWNSIEVSGTISLEFQV